MKKTKAFDISIRMEVLIIMLILAALSCISYIFSIQAGDINVFVSASKQADFIEEANFFTRAIKQWELKGAFMREYIYFIYSFAKMFADFGSPLFMVFVKLGSLIVTIIIILMVSKILTKNFYDFAIIASFMITGISSAHFLSHVQAELLCVTICLLIYALAKKVVLMEYRESILYLILIGGLISSLFFLKSILLIMSLSVLLAVLLGRAIIFNQLLFRKIAIVFFSALGFLAFFMIVINAINPTEIASMFNASIYQESIFNTKLTLTVISQDLMDFTEGFCEEICLNPIMLFGCSFGLFQFAKGIKNKELRRCLLRIGMWSIPIIFILVSRKFFTYHYAVLIFPSLIECMEFINSEKESMEISIKKFSKVFPVSLIVVSIFIFYMGRTLPGLFNNPVMKFILLLFGFLSLALAFLAAIWQPKYLKCSVMLSLGVSLVVFINYTSFLSGYNVDAKKMQETVYYENKNKNLDLDKEEKCLYLDSGLGTWTLGLESEMMEFFPLSLQRISEDSPYTDIPIYVNNKKQVLAYQGRYVCVLDRWFFNGKNTDIMEKLQQEYVVIAQYPICWTSGDVFHATYRMKTDHLWLYERK